MKLIGLCRLGKTAELRNVGDTCVANLALAFNYGKKGEDGNKPTQWVEGALWGNRAEALEQYLLKGQQLLVTLSDVHIETYARSEGGEGSKLVGRVDDLEFAGPPPSSDNGGGRGAQQGNQRQAAPQQQRSQGGQGYGGNNQRQQAPAQSAGQRANQGRTNAPAGGRSGFDDMDSEDIPFISASMHHDIVTSKAKKMAKYDY